MRPVVTNILIAVAGGLVVLAGAFFWFAPKSSLVSSSVTPSPFPGPSETVWEKTISEAGLSMVAVQTFDGPRLIKSGSGTVVSSDGIIFTPYETVPYGTGSYIYQVAVGDNVYRATVVARQHPRNLALLKIQTPGLTIGRLVATDDFPVGRQVALVSATIVLSHMAPQALYGSIVSSEGRQVILDADRTLVTAGAQVVISDGGVLGSAVIRSGRVSLIPSSEISEFLETYLQSIRPTP